MISKIEHIHVVIGVLLFSYFVEFSQYFNLLDLLNLQNSKVAKIIFGTTYNVLDFIAYSIGAFILCIPQIAIKLYKDKVKI